MIISNQLEALVCIHRIYNCLISFLYYFYFYTISVFDLLRLILIRVRLFTIILHLGLRRCFFLIYSLYLKSNRVVDTNFYRMILYRPHDIIFNFYLISYRIKLTGTFWTRLIGHALARVEQISQTFMCAMNFTSTCCLERYVRMKGYSIHKWRRCIDPA